MKKILVLLLLCKACFAAQCDWNSVKPKVNIDEISGIYGVNPTCDCDKAVNKWHTMGNNKCVVSYCSNTKKVYSIVCTKEGGGEAIRQLKKMYNVY